VYVNLGALYLSDCNPTAVTEGLPKYRTLWLVCIPHAVCLNLLWTVYRPSGKPAAKAQRVKEICHADALGLVLWQKYLASDNRKVPVWSRGFPSGPESGLHGSYVGMIYFGCELTCMFE